MVLEFISLITWTWRSLFWKIINYEFNFKKCLLNYSYYLFHLVWILLVSSFFFEISFNLNCQIYWHRFVHSIPLLYCWCLRVCNYMFFCVPGINNLCLLFLFVILARVLSVLLFWRTSFSFHWFYYNFFSFQFYLFLVFIIYFLLFTLVCLTLLVSNNEKLDHWFEPFLL